MLSLIWLGLLYSNYGWGWWNANYDQALHHILRANQINSKPAQQR